MKIRFLMIVLAVGLISGCSSITNPVAPEPPAPTDAAADVTLPTGPESTYNSGFFGSGN